MTLNHVFFLLRKEYYRALELKFVKNPMAYALYQVWKIADAEKEGDG